jgi:hypothetical protein
MQKMLARFSSFVDISANNNRDERNTVGIDMPPNG